MLTEIVSESDIPLEGLALINFHADWCGPCQMFTPVFEELSVHFGNELFFGRVDVQNKQKIAQNFDVLSIPCTFLFKDGIPKEKIQGYKPYGQFENYLKQKLNY
ncbi:thioredoxin family protein [Liquorilactobacillus mali]|uniref:Thioredoxin n=1 Tax=Liquorilactobacillus mali KCTC 3596 = DSM 20444 TaxID=1046596 RepID=J0L3D3_9LACO|nr:thioredoxin domain-containing protein [Liquorilactobacillus mali]EJE97510.1 thioredoxin [Liquorilactobacillus mali KCTC 3596 = DSM 20444]KRN10009.1 thioredoxin [Liquorilactobacillus mali KCTC 3596 = DSM 20444]QFQ73838.1 thiol reductase thioredoxin [Liquorilactobacillus mali]